MHDEIIDKKQGSVLEILKKFSDKFGMVGGTACALVLGHRQSIDFDLFANADFSNLDIIKKIKGLGFSIDRNLVDEKGQFTCVIKGVKFTFLYFPFAVKLKNQWNDIIKLPDLATLCALKAYTLGRRSKWKDYVDLYFSFESGITLNEIVAKAEIVFQNEFNTKLFRSQLAYHQDIDKSEKIIYMPNKEVTDKKIEAKLIAISLEK